MRTVFGITDEEHEVLLRIDEACATAQEKFIPSAVRVPEGALPERVDFVLTATTLSLRVIRDEGMQSGTVAVQP